MLLYLRPLPEVPELDATPLFPLRHSSLMPDTSACLIFREDHEPSSGTRAIATVFGLLRLTEDKVHALLICTCKLCR